jgi:ribonuclease-3 family protein
MVDPFHEFPTKRPSRILPSVLVLVGAVLLLTSVLWSHPTRPTIRLWSAWSPALSHFSSSASTIHQLGHNRLPRRFLGAHEAGASIDTSPVVIPPLANEITVPWPNVPAPPNLGGVNVRTWSPLALAFIGDSVWELYMRQSFFTPRVRQEDFNRIVKSATCAEAQAHCYQRLIADEFLTPTERQVLKWGRNAVVKSAGCPRRLRSTQEGCALYRAATAVECLVGYLHITDPPRLVALLGFLGFPNSAPTVTTPTRT